MKYPLFIRIYVIFLKICQTMVGLKNEPAAVELQTRLNRLNDLYLSLPIPQDEFQKLVIKQVINWIDKERQRVLSANEFFQTYAMK